MCIMDWKTTVFSPLLRVIFGSVPGRTLFERCRTPNDIHGSIHAIHMIHAHPRKKLRKNLCHLVRSSCFPKTIPTSPRAKPPPTVSIMETGMKARKTVTHSHEEIIHPSQILATKAAKSMK